MEEIVIDPKKRWYNAGLNTMQVVNNGIQMPEHVLIKDETLREGLETPGVHPSIEQVLSVARQLAAAGIKEVELGSLDIAEHKELLRVVKAAGLGFRTSVHSGAIRAKDWKEKIGRAAELDADGIFFETEVRSPWNDSSIGKIGPCIAEAKRQGLFCSFALASPARSSLPLIISAVTEASDAGVDRLYVADGPGCASPQTIAFLIRLFRDLNRGRSEIAVHCHNDLGLALASSLAAVGAGATVVDCVVNGLGDRAGNAATEEVVLALSVLYGVETGIDISQIYPLSRTVAEAYGIPLPANKAHVGDNAYRHATDVHVTDILRGKWSDSEVIRAEALNRSRTLEFGPTSLHTGNGAVLAKIERMDLNATAPQLQSIIAQLEKVVEKEGYAREEEVEAIVRQTLLT